MDGFFGKDCTPCPGVGSKTDPANPLQLANVCNKRGLLHVATTRCFFNYDLILTRTPSLLNAPIPIDAHLTTTHSV